MSRSTLRKRSSASFFPRPDALALAAFLSVVPTAPNAAEIPEPGEDFYFDLIYDFEVASFCGLIGEEVYTAFWKKRRAYEAETERSEKRLKSLRIVAMAEADLELQNRGLGGYRPWCAKEGMAGVQRILED